MSKEIYHFEAAENPSAGHSLKEKVTAVYKLAGSIEKRYRNAEDGSPKPYWAYVERGGKETGIESDESAIALESKLSGERTDGPEVKKIGSVQRLFIGLHSPNGAKVCRDTVIKILASKLDTFTVTDVWGYYQGTPEPTLVVEVAKTGGADLGPLARDLADVFDQDAVGLEKGGIYTRVFGEAKRATAKLAEEDRRKLHQFTKALSNGETFDELDAELRAWWINRY